MNRHQQAFLDGLQEVDAHAFEALVADLWSKQGWDTHVTRAVSDGGIDIFAEQVTPYPQKQAIQVKRYDPANAVGRPDIQQYASIRQEQTDVDTVIVVTTGRFTDEARAAARSLNVKLIDGPQLYNLIDTLDAFTLVDGYLAPESDSVAMHASEPSDDAAQTAASEAVAAPRGDREATQVSNVPTTISALLTVRTEITETLDQLESTLERAETLIAEDNYVEAVDPYQEAGALQAASQQAVARYDAGLTTIDTATTEHLPATDTFLTRLEQYTARISAHAAEASHTAERIRALEQLVSDLLESAESIEQLLAAGDQILNQPEESFERASARYQEASSELDNVRKTKSIYDGLCAEYDPVIVENHAGLPEEFSVEGTESDIQRRLSSETTYDDLEAVSQAATGTFPASLLLSNEGELFEDHLYEYIPEDDTLEFVFEPPRRGFKTAEPDSELALFHDDPFVAGSSFVLITDQQVLYVAGVGDHDETEHIPLSEIADVEATVNNTTSRITVTTVDGMRYALEGVGSQSVDLESAVTYLRTHAS